MAENRTRGHWVRGA